MNPWDSTWIWRDSCCFSYVTSCASVWILHMSEKFPIVLCAAEENTLNSSFTMFINEMIRPNVFFMCSLCVFPKNSYLELILDNSEKWLPRMFLRPRHVFMLTGDPTCWMLICRWFRVTWATRPRYKSGGVSNPIARLAIRRWAYKIYFLKYFCRFWTFAISFKKYF